ncbi:hypothetical protein BLOT_007454 [Blomia tropicalis]|nr:hypothetical protein BLOT_007454 [Blomia tropicalis]
MSSTTGYKYSRQSLSNDTSLATTSSSSSFGSLRRILLPAFQSIVSSPFRILRQLLNEVFHFMQNHHIWELYDVRFLQQIASRIPDRTFVYWNTLMEVEAKCVQRTICDLSEFTSHHIPKWAEQISLIYLNTFVERYPTYQVIIHGLTTRQCRKFYADCDPDSFITRLKGNVTESIATTVEPLKDAINGLVNATASTIQSLAESELTEDDENNLVRSPILG